MEATAANGTALLSLGEDEFLRLWSDVRVAVHWNLLAAQCTSAWVQARAFVLAPLVRLLVVFALAMTVMILLEKLFVAAVCLVAKLFGLQPERRYGWRPIAGDEESGSAPYPMVLVQILMYNESKVCKLSIGAACSELRWPSDRVIVQVLDDSTDPVVKDLVELECQKWRSKGVNIKYEVRWKWNRKGYKAGALREGLRHDYVKDCEYIAMFDADFQPEPNFLLRTVPFLLHNPELALVQARWKFVNADECLLTRFQEMSLDYHFKFEQEAGSSVYSFFGFNGTAGVWRISAIADAGGWKHRTTVEDMDLAVRAALRGWKFVYVGEVRVKSELPSTFEAYRFQQHRLSCGPANLFKKMSTEILENKIVSLWGKIHLWYDFFFVGKIATHTVTFIYYCFTIPVSVFFPEIHIPLWGLVYVPTIITLCKSLGKPRSFHLLILWVLFENVMSFHRLKAAMAGLLEAGRVNEWVVTEKLGDPHMTKAAADVDSDAVKVADAEQIRPMIVVLPKYKKKLRFCNRCHLSELLVGACIMLSGCYDLLYSKKGYFIYLFLQGLAFLVAGVGYIGTSPPGTELNSE